MHGYLGQRESVPKRHLDRFSLFCTASPCAEHTVTHTTLRATSVAIGRIYAVHAMRPIDNNSIVVAVIPVGEVEEMMMLRALESSDKQQQITWRDQTEETVFTDLPGYIAAGSDVNSLPIDLLTDNARNLDKRWADHNDSKSSSSTCTFLSSPFKNIISIFGFIIH